MSVTGPDYALTEAENLSNYCIQLLARYFLEKALKALFSSELLQRPLVKMTRSCQYQTTMTNNYLVNFDFLSVGVDGQGLSFDAVSGLDFADDDRAHVGVLVHDGHHEGAVDVALKRRKRIQVRYERLLPR